MQTPYPAEHPMQQEFLLQLLEYIYGPRPMRFTSADLFNQGFDDSSEPNWSDYYSDYIDRL